MIDDAFAYIDANGDRFLDELFALIRQPSISATGEGVSECAAHVLQAMSDAGMQVQSFESEGHPFLYGEAAGPEGSPTVLVYGHYDVQPPDPIDQWHSPPFEPTIRDGKIYARGSGDNKGQFFAQVKGIEALVKSGGVPATVKVILEGEEEIGSPHIGRFIAEHRDLLACDLVYCSDGHHNYGDRPEVLYGVRGLLYVELTARGPNRDLHSGNFGGMVNSPIERLSRLVPLMKDEINRILIPGFYDDVKEPSAADAEAIAGLPFDATAAAADLGIDALAGDPELHPLVKRLLKPTLNVNGIYGGYTGKGSKTIIPSEATMKIDFRLVDAQQPPDIFEKFKDFLKANGYDDLEVKTHGMMTPWRTPVDHEAAAPVLRAVEKGFDAPPYRVPSLGGSLPLAEFIQLDRPIFLVPYAQPDEHNHSPNESMAVENFLNGAKTMAALLAEVSK